MYRFLFPQGFAVEANLKKRKNQVQTQFSQMRKMATNEEKKYTKFRGAVLDTLWPHSDPQLSEVEVSGLRLLGSPESSLPMATPPAPRQEDRRLGTLERIQ